MNKIKYLFYLVLVSVSLSSCSKEYSYSYNSNSEENYHFSSLSSLKTVELGLFTQEGNIPWGSEARVSLSIGHNIKDKDIQQEYITRVDNILLYFSSNRSEKLNLEEIYSKENDDYKYSEDLGQYFLFEIKPEEFFSDEYLYTYTQLGYEIELTYPNLTTYSFPCDFIMGSKDEHSRFFYFYLYLIIPSGDGFIIKSYGVTFYVWASSWGYDYNIAC